VASLDVPTRLALGRLLRELRQRERLTLAALSAQVGVTVSALSQFETGRAEPSLGTLSSLGRALNASLFDFFAQQETENLDVTPAGGRIVVVQDRARYEAIARSSRRKLDLFYLYLQPGDGAVREPVSHAGEEAGVVISGAMQVLVGEQTHRLDAGDGIWFVSNQPHTFTTIGDVECVSVWADTLPDHAPEHQEIESVFGDGRPVGAALPPIDGRSSG
jgi:transcriptional regulator with XRE-family HTH domain